MHKLAFDVADLALEPCPDLPKVAKMVYNRYGDPPAFIQISQALRCDIFLYFYMHHVLFSCSPIFCLFDLSDFNQNSLRCLNQVSCFGVKHSHDAL